MLNVVYQEKVRSEHTIIIRTLTQQDNLCTSQTTGNVTLFLNAGYVMHYNPCKGGFKEQEARLQTSKKY